MIRRSFVALAAAATLALTFVAPASALDRAMTPEEQQMITEINAHNSGIRTMVGRFLQIDSAGERIEGTFYLERPNKIKFRYNPPSREEIVSVGRGFYVVDRKEQTQYAYPQDKIPLRQFLNENIDFFKTNIVDLTRADNYFSITIADDTPSGVVQVSLIFDVNTKELAQWTLVEPNGGQLTFSLFDVQKGVDIPKSFFYIDPTFRAIEPKLN